MSLKRIASFAVLVFAGAPFPLFAQSLISLPVAPAAASFENLVPAYLPAPDAAGAQSKSKLPASLDPFRDFEADISDAVASQVLFKSPRKRVADFAMKLRDIRYRRGGREPSTGFDCSGFVHYVYNRTFGLDLPYDAPSQFTGGEKVSREQMKAGDLVFFQVGKRITHVGIYLDNGRFIHSPSPGKRVRVDSLDSTYWAKRYAGAKRPSGLS